MRPADAVGYDGLRNFANAVRVASDAAAAGRGVLVVMGDRVFAARDVRKVRTRGAEAFRGFPRESVGLVTPGSLQWFGAPWRGGEQLYAWQDNLPRVAIVYAHADLRAEEVLAQASGEVRGIVLAGVGEGNMPQGVRDALASLAARGIAIVRASRTEEGLVDREDGDAAHGFVAARALNPQKARILLQVLLANGVREGEAMQRAFDAG